MPGWVQGRVALVTGASRGIGVGIARCLAKEGAKVAVAARTKEGLAATCREIEALGAQAMAVRVDLSREADATRMVQDVGKAWGPVEILVNNAGVHGAADFSEHYPETTADWEAAFRVNALARVWACDAVLPSMKERKWGKIINVASIAGIEGTPVHMAYSAAKAAEINYTQSLAKDIGRYGINVNVVLPGLVYTDMIGSLQKHIATKYNRPGGESPKRWFDGIIKRTTPLQREQTVDDIGWMVTFLCSPLAREVHGQAINVDGGMRLH
ncbi:MAG: SDR family oxidoreductase [Chloroflexi bacterium]|nr:SDR family oxidoreductase [Chloroflexota bacterium]